MTVGIPPPYGAAEARAARPARPWGWFTAGFACGFVSLLVLGVLAATVWVGPELTARIEAPASVRAGETFTVLLHAQNPHAEPVELDSVAVSVAFLERMDLRLLEPPANEASPLDLLGDRTWTFDRQVPPGGALTVAFEATARAPGSHQLELKVCNGAADCTAARTSLAVVPAS